MRRRAMTWSAVSLRSDNGFNAANMTPELRCWPPVKPTTFCTAGSLPMIAMKSASFTRIAWNEMLWSA